NSVSSIQLEDGHSLFDYDVGLNDIIQLIIRPPPLPSTSPHSTCDNGGASGDMDTGENGASNGGDDVGLETIENGANSSGMENGGMENGGVENGGIENGTGSHDQENGDTTEGLYRVGEKVDARDCNMGAWFEAQVVKVMAKQLPAQSTGEETSSTAGEIGSQLCYHVLFDDYKEDEPVQLMAAHVRPRARYRYQWSQLSVGQVVMVNYNFDSPKERGFWYDGAITKKVNEGRQLFCKLILGSWTSRQRR
ncbi:E3 ubiquitin-protein ligase UHRF1, partial [Geodia barretti]